MDKKIWNEEEILNKIKESAEDVEVPESLSPEQILKKLEEQERKKDSVQGEEETTQKEQKKISHWRKYAVRLAETAAVLLIIAAAGSQIGENRIPAEEKAALETEMVAEPEQQPKAAAQVEDVPEPEAVQEEMAPESETEPQAASAPGDLRPVTDSAELFQKLWDYRNIQMLTRSLSSPKAVLYSDMAVEETAMDPVYDSGETSVQNTAASETGDFSETNTREAGVDEGDIVKTDGEFLYIMKGNASVRIVKSDGAKMEETAVIHPESLNENICDMYLDGERLILITKGVKSSMTESDTDVYTVENTEYVRVITYDITDRKEPKEIGNVTQEGSYKSSRKNGEYLYLFTAFEPRLETKEDQSRIMPLINGTEMETQRIYVPEYLKNTTYLVMGAIDLEKPSEIADSKAVVSGADSFYVSQDHIYIYNEEWSNDTYVTRILKFGYKDGEITGAAAGQVDGYLNDSFSIDEYQGYLRLVVTDWNSGEDKNSLYILDEELNIVGEITDLAPGETIRSARFMGDTGYFVTFRQMDPLFSVDLSDPENPKILGELKIPGFSSYLHVYGENLLLGIGYEADPDNGSTTGVKISMFDISDPSNVTEIDKYVINGAVSLPAAASYKTVMIDPEKNLFGFACDSEYLVFSYDAENGFVNELTHHLMTDGNSYWYDNEDYRGMYAGEWFYLADEEEVLAFDMENEFSLEGRLELD